MRILFLEWDSFGQEYIKQEFEKAGYEIINYIWPFGKEEMRSNPSLIEKLKKKLEEENVLFVFSLNYFPVAAIACYSCGIKYVSWVYDSPYMLLYSDTVRLASNYIFVFDTSQYEELRAYGADTVYYLPLAAPVEYYDSLKKTAAEERWNADISFVGATYGEDRQGLEKWLSSADDYTKGYLEAIVQMQHQISGGFLLEELLTEDILQHLRQICPIPLGEDEWESESCIYANYFLARRVTALDRKGALKALSEQQDVKLYTPEATPGLPRVRNMGPVDYHTQMPLVFANSRINLNITLRSIHSGIPLRAMDIMGSGGFLLTNRQADFDGLFEDGVDYVSYTDEEDLCGKAQYYLSHEAERKQIAENGLTRMREAHTYGHRIRTILETVLDQEDTVLYARLQKLDSMRDREGREPWYKYLMKDKTGMPAGRLVQETEQSFADMERERTDWFLIKEKMLERIDLLMQEQSAAAWDRLVLLLRHTACRRMFSFFSEFTVLYTFAEVYLKEKKQGTDSVVMAYACRAEAEHICDKLVFTYRRIEYDMTEGLHDQLLALVAQGRISPMLLRQVLDDARGIGDKENVWQKLTGIMSA